MVPCYGACAAPDLALSRTCKVSTALQKTFASRCMDFLQEPVWGIIDGTGAGKVTFQMSLVWSGLAASLAVCVLYLPLYVVVRLWAVYAYFVLFLDRIAEE